MSSEQSLDPQVIEETRQQLRGLVHEVEQLSRSEVEVGEFYEGFLTRVVTALAAPGGAVWTKNAGGQLELTYQINLHQTGLVEREDDQARHGKLLHRVLSNSEGLIVSPHSGDEEAANPSDFLLVMAALKSDQQTEGVIEIFQRSGNRPTVERGYLRFLLQMCDLAGDYLKTRRLRHFTDRQTLWARLESFTRTAHQTLDPRQTAYTIANEGRRLIECDRVTVAIRKGNKCKVEAISGQDAFDRRSNTVSLLERLTTAVTATGEEVWYTGDTSDLPPQVEEALQEYIDDSHSKTVAVLPLSRPLVEGEEPDDEHPPEIVGALVVEQIEESRLPEGFRQRVTVVADHSSTAMANSLQHNSLFLMPVWRAIGQAQWIVQARTLPKTLAITGGVLLALLFLAIWPSDFKVQGRGTLEPVLKREVFAGVEGVVTNVSAEHGQQVHAGDLLGTMRNTDLDVKIEEVVGKQAETLEEIKAAQRKLIDKRTSEDDRSHVAGQLAQYNQAYESLQRQRELYQTKLKQLEIRSPINGEIVTWQVRDKLIHRPVEKGAVLMSVADPTGDWELEVHMPEDRIGYVVDARNDLKPDLPVEFILATSPGVRHHGTVKEVHAAAEVKGEEGSVVLVRVALDPADLAELKQGMGDLRPGATVTAKVYCGRRSIGYVWFHDVINWINSKVLFRL